MFQNFVIFIVNFALALQLVNGQNYNQKCRVNIKTDLSDRKEPVYLTIHGELWAPDGSSLEWNFCKASVVTCTRNNQLTLNGVTKLFSFAPIICLGGNLFWTLETMLLTNQIQCKNAVTGNILNTDRSCEAGGTMLHIGFNELNGMVVYIYSCYNMQTGSVVYTKHTVYGKAIKHKMIQDTSPAWKKIGSAPGGTPEIDYKQSSQKQRFSNILQSELLAEKYINETSFLARGHMSPAGDGIFRTWQYATYFYTNAVPQWQAVNNGNWKIVEDIVRKTADMLQENIEVYTGVYDVLALPDINDTLVQITLGNGTIEVPKWTYKIIKSPIAAIAFFTLNNPFATSIAASDLPCTNVCNLYNWIENSFANYSKGFTICCEVNDLSRRVRTVPYEATARYKLNGNGEIN